MLPPVTPINFVHCKFIISLGVHGKTLQEIDNWINIVKQVKHMNFHLYKLKLFVNMTTVSAVNNTYMMNNNRN